MASGWSVTLSCGCSYRLLSAVPDLRRPYLCQVADGYGAVHGMRSIDMAVRNKQNGNTETETENGNG